LNPGTKITEKLTDILMQVLCRVQLSSVKNSNASREVTEKSSRFRFFLIGNYLCMQHSPKIRAFFIFSGFSGQLHAKSNVDVLRTIDFRHFPLSRSARSTIREIAENKSSKAQQQMTISRTTSPHVHEICLEVGNR